MYDCLCPCPLLPLIWDDGCLSSRTTGFLLRLSVMARQARPASRVINHLGRSGEVVRILPARF